MAPEEKRTSDNAAEGGGDMFQGPFYSLGILSKYTLHKSRDLGLSAWSGRFINICYGTLTTFKGHF